MKALDDMIDFWDRTRAYRWGAVLAFLALF
jgi:hypothetical protein